MMELQLKGNVIRFKKHYYKLFGCFLGPFFVKVIVITLWSVSVTKQFLHSVTNYN